jgi:hypothetical protein
LSWRSSLKQLASFSGKRLDPKERYGGIEVLFAYFFFQEKVGASFVMASR